MASLGLHQASQGLNRALGPGLGPLWCCSGLGGTDVRTDRWRIRKFPMWECTGHRPLQGHCPKSEITSEEKFLTNETSSKFLSVFVRKILDKIDEACCKSIRWNLNILKISHNSVDWTVASAPGPGPGPFHTSNAVMCMALH